MTDDEYERLSRNDDLGELDALKDIDDIFCLAAWVMVVITALVVIAQVAKGTF